MTATANELDLALDREEFTKRFRALLAASGLTQTALQERSGIKQAQLSQYLSGKKGPPGFEVVCALADAFGVSTEAFREGSKEVPNIDPDAE